MFNGSYFTTESYPANQRMDAWRESLGKFSLHMKDKSVDGGFYGSISSATSPQGILFGRITSSPQELVYRDEAPSGGICLALHMEGDATLFDDNRKIGIEAGDILYGPAGATAGVSLQSNFRQLLVKIPRQAFRSRLAVPLSMKVGRLSGHSGIGHVFAGLLGSIADTIEHLTVDQIRPIEIALSEFLITSLADEDSSTGMLGATSTQTAILHRISQLIESRLNDPDLSINQIAQDAGVSARYLQKLFESASESFSHYLRTRRLERCRADLINPLYAHLSISDICFRWSFNDAAHFSRAFRDEYGMSPRAYRREIGDPISKSMLLHMSRGWPDISHDTYKKLTRDEETAMRSARGSSEDESAADDRAKALGRSAKTIGGFRHHHVAANEKNVHWGYFSRNLQPVLEVDSGDYVTMETLSHHSADDYDRMIKGDSGAESVFHWTPEQKNIDRRGAGPLGATVYGRGAGEGFGVHICTGPIAVKGAEPGDVIEVRILDVRPRPCANATYGGSAFGSNAAAWWGFHYKELLTEPKGREVVTIYEVDCTGDKDYAKAVYNFRWTPQTDPNGIVHTTIDYPGVRVDHNTIQENHGVLKNVRIPVRPHFGVLALAPREADLIDSIPPSYFGGNIDDKRAGKGSTMYLPVSVPGGLFSVGDPHASQGDGEVCGTAIECSLTGVFQLVLHKKHTMDGKPFADLNYPLLETPEEWVLHGFTYSNYLAELGDKAQSEIYKKSSLDPAMQDAFRKMRRFLMTTKGLTEDEAISLMSVAVDFGITQVVDGNWCVHGILRKSLFVDEDS
ncbi:MAG: Transcriptional regulator, AraC family [Nevskia sp.]|nr:Transcriptional regulator, AraC family [Nevskia sp.]